VVDRPPEAYEPVALRPYGGGDGSIGVARRVVDAFAARIPRPRLLAKLGARDRARLVVIAHETGHVHG
jgi:hypothetical protein